MCECVCVNVYTYFHNRKISLWALGYIVKTKCLMPCIRTKKENRIISNKKIITRKYNFHMIKLSNNVKISECCSKLFGMYIKLGQ